MPIKKISQSPIKVSEITSQKNVFFCYTKNVQIIYFSQTPTKSSARTDTFPSWQSYMIVLCRQTNVEHSNYLVMTRLLFSLRSNGHFTSVKAARQGVTMAWTDSHTWPTYTPLFSLAPDIVYGLKDWVRWDPRLTFCSICHEAHDEGSHKGRGKTKCWVGAGRQSDFP